MNAGHPHRTHLSEQLCRMLEETAFMLVEDREAPAARAGPRY
jgi:hypothetical protein